MCVEIKRRQRLVISKEKRYEKKVIIKKKNDKFPRAKD